MGASLRHKRLKDSWSVGAYMHPEVGEAGRGLERQREFTGRWEERSPRRAETMGPHPSPQLPTPSPSSAVLSVESSLPGPGFLSKFF